MMNMRRFAVILLAGVLCCVSCATLSKSERRAVDALTLRSDTVSRAPSLLIASLAEVRLERGLMYAASLSSPQARQHELIGLADGVRKDRTDAGQADAYVSVLNSYLRALKSLAADSRTETLEGRLRTLGRRGQKVLDELIELDGELAALPVDYVTLVGKVAAEIGGAAMRERQGRLVRRLVQEADTLVGATCDSLIAILQGEEMTALIAHEREGLRANYLVLLQSMTDSSGRVAGVGASSAAAGAGASAGAAALMLSEFDRRYVALELQVKEATEIRNRCASALRSLKNAHSKLSVALRDKSLKKKDEDKAFWDALDDLSSLATSISSELNN